MINSPKLVFGQIDLSDQQQLINYERAFYNSFVKVESNRLVRQLWLWDRQAKRLATCIPYGDQIIYALWTAQGDIDTGFAVNTTLKAFQSVAYGFPPPVDPAGSCEILTFFSVTDRRAAVKIKFWQQCSQELARLGFHTAYATCAPHPLKTFCRVGGQVLAEADIQKERRFFLKFSLGNSPKNCLPSQRDLAQV
jgi:hypothetical protein